MGAINLSNGVQLFIGAGSPEGTVTAVVGSLYFRTDGDGGRALYTKENGAGNTGWTPSYSAREAADLLLQPEGRTVAQSTRVCQTVYDGAAMVLRRHATLSGIKFRLTAATLPVTVRVLLYQAAGGGSGIASLVATATVVIGVGGAQTVTAAFAEGIVQIQEGLCYVLFGRSSAGGTATMRTYAAANYDLLTANVDNATHPTTFTTTLALAAVPATLNPLPTGGGGDATGGGALDLAPVLRLVT